MNLSPGNENIREADAERDERLRVLSESNRELQRQNKVLVQKVALLENAHKEHADVLHESQVVVLRHSFSDDWPVTFISENIEDWLGYSIYDFLKNGLCYQDIIYEADRVQVVNQIKQYVDERVERFKLAPYRVVSKNNQVLWVQQSSKLILDVAGVPTHLRSSLVDITQRKHIEEVLQERQAYLWTLRNTMQTGMLVVDCETGSIMDANPCAEKMVGCGPGELVGMFANNFIVRTEVTDHTKGAEDSIMPEGQDCVLQAMTGREWQVRRSCARAVIGDREYSIQSFLDISDIRQMLDKQTIDIDLARNVLRLVNRIMPRYLYLQDEVCVYLCAASMPCYAEGGDHFFVRTISSDSHPSGKRTFITLKDQSGHQVSCVLRSTITDLMHHAVLTNHCEKGLGAIIYLLNNAICRSELFQREDFVTAVVAELNHETLILNYLTAGHPPFLLIRNRHVMLFPEVGGQGAFIPLAVVTDIPYRAESIQLYEGDKLIFYTDGLTEMPMKKVGQVLSRDDLKEMVREIISEEQALGVSLIMQRLLQKVADFSGEKVEPSGRNTSADDVTLLAIEIESPGGFEEVIWHPESSAALTVCINQLYEKLTQQWAIRGFNEAEIRLRSILEEATLNAWKHGNQCNPEKSIIVRWKFTNDFHLEVVDEGKGFDVDAIMDPTLPENVLKPGGRGLFIIRYYADSVRWTDQGKRVVITIQRVVISAEVQERNATERLMELWRLSD